MKKIIALGMLASLLNAGLLHAQAETAIAVKASNTTNAVITTEPATTIAATSAVVADVPADAAPKPPEDPLKNMIARFSFDAGLTPDPTSSNFVNPLVFQRESPVFLNGQELGADMPRLVEGKFGQGLLLESAYANLYGPSQAGADEASMFQALNGSTLAGTTGKPWEGKQALTITTKGEAGDEGMALELKVEKALYKGTSIVPAHYAASVYLKGQGNLKMFLKDLDSDTSGESMYIDLSDEWKRFACTFGYSFPATNIGAKHEADWKTLLPPGTNIAARLQLVIVTTDSSKTTFYADGLQLEQRDMPYARTDAGPAPHAWIPGGTALASETIRMETKDNAFACWRKNGTISFWFLPNWDARDGTHDTILQIMPSLMTLHHVHGKLQLAPAGVAFTPSDWQATWHHIAITWNEEGHWVMYVDGLDYPNDETIKRPLTAATALVLGSASATTTPNGVIDDLMLFQITLTPDQIQALFNGNLLKPGAIPAPPTTPAPDATTAPAGTADTPSVATALTPTIPAATTSEPDESAESTEDTEEDTEPESEPAATNSWPALMPAATNSHAPQAK
ncbi:MAG: LamG-like jellyroll fold domain-containing protein [Verrucomicrobiota bacterium]